MVRNILQIGKIFLRTGKFPVRTKVKTLLQVGIDAVSSGNLPIGSKLSKTLDSGTVVDVINKGKGVLQKVVKKQNGDEFTSIFKDGNLQKMIAKNSRGEYMIEPQVNDLYWNTRFRGTKKHVIMGKVDINEPTPLTFYFTKGLNEPCQGKFSYLDDLNDVNRSYGMAGAKKLYDYLVKQNPNETLKDLYKYDLKFRYKIL